MKHVSTIDEIMEMDFSTGTDESESFSRSSVIERIWSDRSTLGAIESGSKNIFVEDGTTIVGVTAFAGRGEIESVTIPPSVKNIRLWAFIGCRNLKRVVMLGPVIGTKDEKEEEKNDKGFSLRRKIGEEVFAHCPNLVEVVLPSNLSSVGEGAFLDCPSLERVVFTEKTVWEIMEMKHFPFGLTSKMAVVTIKTVSLGNFVVGYLDWNNGLA